MGKGRREDGPEAAAAEHSFLAGCVAGIVGCLVGHPFDTLKLQQQTSTGRLTLSTGYTRLLSTGGQAALWRGVGPALAVQVVTSGFLFGTQTSISDRMARSLTSWQWLPSPLPFPTSESDSSEVTAAAAAGMAGEYRLQQAMAVSSVTCATLSGFLTGGLLAPIVCPLEGIKCRAQVAATATVVSGGGGGGVIGRAAVAAAAAAAASFVNSPVQFLRSMYAGFLPSVLRCSFGNAAFFGVYALSQSVDAGAAVGGAVAGVAFWVAGMPFDVIKSRMQTREAVLSAATTTTAASGGSRGGEAKAARARARATMRGTLLQLLSQGGLRGLYAGLPVTLLRAVPMNAAVLATYELVKQQQQ